MFITSNLLIAVTIVLAILMILICIIGNKNLMRFGIILGLIAVSTGLSSVFIEDMYIEEDTNNKCNTQMVDTSIKNKSENNLEFINAINSNYKLYVNGIVLSINYIDLSEYNPNTIVIDDIHREIHVSSY